MLDEVVPVFQRYTGLDIEECYSILRTIDALFEV